MDRGLSAMAGSLDRDLRPLSLEGRLALVAETLPGRIVFTTSFGLEDQAITHALPDHDALAVVTLETGRLFPETHAVWAETEARYGRRIEAFVPGREALEALLAEQGVNGFRASLAARQACCGVRKVGPLARALAGASAWITGLRADQSGARDGTPLAAFDPERGLVKISPLADWSRDDLVRYVADRRIPYNALHDRGFASIGCAPCTRAIRPGEAERAGRWWWEADEKKECGLHRPGSGRAAQAHAAAAGALT